MERIQEKEVEEGGEKQMTEVELSEYIRYIKKQITQSEDPRPSKGFWIGMQSAEITFQTTTEVIKDGGLKIYFLSGQVSKADKTIQTIKMTFVTQHYEYETL